MIPNLSMLLAAQGGGGGGLVLLIELAVIVAIFYFLLIRPQRKLQQRHREMLAALKRGDRIVTDGGVIGEVIHLTEDQVTVKSGESRFIVARGKIARVLSDTEAKS